MTFHRDDYIAPHYRLPKTELTFTLNPTKTLVEATLHFEDYQTDKPLILDGIDLTLKEVLLDEKPCEYKQGKGTLTLAPKKKNFSLKTIVEINPKDNTCLAGLYMSNGLFTTQNEPQGFRRITYYPDHPDVLSTYTVTIKANQKTYPVRLSNGNVVKENSTSIIYHDPYPKPCYLFALVAGKLDVLTDTYTTKSGKKVDLYLYCEPGKKERLTFAMESLKRAMKWDEDTFGLEYDLNRFSIVAVSHFNAGAMENKSLNIFNDSLLLASPMTATDWTYAAIETTVGHEYFHNYSGDRVTLRDWFHLSLKEGFTVFRHTEFGADVRTKEMGRIEDVDLLRASQFVEDDGPLAHPVLLDEAESVDNFYTDTIYEKGAEVIRMMREVVGRKNFMKGCALYFKRHDGQAVTIQDFVRAIEDASGVDLTQFCQWYHIPGRPKVLVQTHYGDHVFTIHAEQSHKRTNDPFVIPLAFGLVGPDGKDILTDTLILDKPRQDWSFDVAQEPVLSINRHFSALVDLEIKYTQNEKLHLIKYDSDLFNRHRVGHQYLLDTLVDMVQYDKDIPTELLDIVEAYLNDSKHPAFVAAALQLPTLSEITNTLTTVDLEKVMHKRAAVRKAIATTYHDKLARIYESNIVHEPYAPVPEQANKRALKNVALSYLALTNDDDRAWTQYKHADNFTDLIEALVTLVHNNLPHKTDALADFFIKYEKDDLALNRWFSVQASTPKTETIDVVKKLLKHPKFDLLNPNRVRAVLGVFCMNMPAFHQEDGYHLLADYVAKLDKVNPHMAARLVQAFSIYKKMDAFRRAHAEQVLKDLLAQKLSAQTTELVQKIIA
ncbi:MAG: aminopeptidase N [Alphaproteobacteria bacterium]|nr:aminopeptidase N [Alphaproteobacteria bacterium]